MNTHSSIIFLIKYNLQIHIISIKVLCIMSESRRPDQTRVLFSKKFIGAGFRWNRLRRIAFLNMHTRNVISLRERERFRDGCFFVDSFFFISSLVCKKNIVSERCSLLRLLLIMCVLSFYFLFSYVVFIL